MAAPISFAKRTDDAIREDVVFELEWEPMLANTDIAVAVNDGVVTLTGTHQASW
jgi:osmotically-inducible protein OsmY